MSSSVGFKHKVRLNGAIINDPFNNLEGEMDNLSKEDLKERLLVAERVMKSLFQRNKELEERVESGRDTGDTT
jgi:hypothetical protein